MSECASWVRKYVRKYVRRGTAGIAGMISSRECAGKLVVMRTISVTRSEFRSEDQNSDPERTKLI